jgi:hypothetical protein
MRTSSLQRLENATVRKRHGSTVQPLSQSPKTSLTCENTMQRLFTTLSSLLTRRARTLALAVALAAPIAGALTTTEHAYAQMSRSTPTPVSATDFARMLVECGLPETTRDIALPLHEGYFARFREFETREVDPALDNAAGGDFALSRTLESAKETRDLRRRLFQRAAQLDAQLVDELVGVLTAEDAVRAERLRDTLARRRAATILANVGFGAGLSGKPETFDLRTCEALRTLDSTTRDAVAPSFDAYGIELTRALERAADARLDVSVKAAELRAERNIPQTPVIDAPQTENAQENAPENGGAEAAADTTPAAQGIDEEWFRRNAEIQREASAEFAQSMLRVRRIHCDALANIEPLVSAKVARAMRADLMRAVYPGIQQKNAFDAALAEAESLRAKGKIDDAQWSAAEAIIDGHDVAARGVLNDLMDLADKKAGNGELGLLMVATNDNQSEEAQRTARLSQELVDLSMRDAEALRATLGLEAVAPQVAINGRAIELNGVGISSAIEGAIGEAIGGAVGGGDAVEANVQVQAVMVGGDGEMISLSSEDMDDAGMMFIGGLAGGGGGPRVPKPFTRDELDKIAACAGLEGAQRPTFDEIAARCAEARNAASEEHGAAGAGGIANLDGSVSFSISVGPDGAVPSANGDGDTDALIAAITTAEETMFDEVRAAAEATRVDAIEAARRARARARFLAGATGEYSVDLVRIIEDAALNEANRAAIATTLETWDEASIGALQTLQREIDEVSKRRQEIFESMMEETTTSDGNGNTNVSRTMEFDGSAAEELSSLATRETAAKKRVADANMRTQSEIETALAGDLDAQKAVRRAYLRAANPSVYRGARELSPFFDKAAALEGVGTQARADIARLRSEWVEERETRFETFINARDEAERESAARLSGSSTDAASIEKNAGEGMRRMQESMRERKRLREDLEQIEATAFRRLQDLLVVEIGAERAKELGELPAKKKPRTPMIQFGN